MLIIAHRGFKKNGEPENSIASIVSAAKNDFDGVEFDVRISSDGKFYLLHDRLLGRTTNMYGRISHKSSFQLEKCLLSNNEKLPKLEDILIILKDYEGLVFLELKISYGEAELIKLLKKYPIKKLVVENFSFKSLRLLRSLDKDLRLHYNNRILTKKNIDSAKAIGCYSIGCPIFFLRKNILDYAKKNKVLVMPFKITSLKKLDKAKELDVEGVYVDDYF
jgi:glycerophosphoryl diester phosphodiesterase